MYLSYRIGLFLSTPYYLCPPPINLFRTVSVSLIFQDPSLSVLYRVVPFNNLTLYYTGSKVLNYGKFRSYLLFKK